MIQQCCNVLEFWSWTMESMMQLWVQRILSMTSETAAGYSKLCIPALNISCSYHLSRMPACHEFGPCQSNDQCDLQFLTMTWPRMYDVENIHHFPDVSFSHEFAKTYSYPRYTEQHVYMAENSGDWRVMASRGRTTSLIPDTSFFSNLSKALGMPFC